MLEDTPLKREKGKGNFRKKEKKTLNMGMTRMRRDCRDGKKWVRKMERKEDTYVIKK